MAAAVSRQSLDVGQFLGARDQLLLGALGGAALGVELGEVLTAAPAEGVARGREPLPQRVVGLPVDALDLLPLVDDRAQPVAGDLPRRAGLRDLLGLGDQRLLRGDRVGARLLARRSALAGLLARHAASSGVQPRVERGEVPDRGGAGQLLLELLGRAAGARRVAGAGLEALLQQVHLGREVLVTGARRTPGRPRVAGLPRADGPLAVGGPDIHRAVVVDPTPRPRLHDHSIETRSARCAQHGRLVLRA